MQTCGTTVLQVGQLHTTKTCSSLSDLLFSLIRNRSTHTIAESPLCSFPINICSEAQITKHQLILQYQLYHTHQVWETELNDRLVQEYSCSRRKGCRNGIKAFLARSSLRNKIPILEWSEVVGLTLAEDLFSRQGARKHQRKIGLLCGVSLVGTYQAYASHVFECPGEQLL